MEIILRHFQCIELALMKCERKEAIYVDSKGKLYINELNEIEMQQMILIFIKII